MTAAATAARWSGLDAADAQLGAALIDVLADVDPVAELVVTIPRGMHTTLAALAEEWTPHSPMSRLGVEDVGHALVASALATIGAWLRYVPPAMWLDRVLVATPPADGIEMHIELDRVARAALRGLAEVWAAGGVLVEPDVAAYSVLVAAVSMARAS